MSTLYEINEQILSCIDQETGEILDEKRLSELDMERTAKLENIALWIKNLTADASAFKAEKEAFALRERSAKQKAESLKRYLSSALEGGRFTTAKVEVSFRRSEAVEVDESLCPEKYMVKKVEISPDKNAIKAILKSGAKIRGCLLVTRQNIQIK